MHDEVEREGWAARPWVMAVLGALAGLLIHLLIDDAKPAADNSLRFAGAAAVGAIATLFAFTFEPVRGRWAAIFAVAAGAVIGLVTYWSGTPDGNSGDVWRTVCIALAVAIAAPLFQTARDEGRANFPYAAVHGHAWTNVVIWFASWAFMGIVFGLAWLLSALFDLIGIKLLHDLLRKDWFNWMLAGASFGAAIGLLRERDRIVGLLQRGVVSVLAVLAPVLGAGLIVFLFSLIFTGLTPLWEATKSTTPILLSCIIGALILANAVIGNSDEEESRFAPLRFGAMALGLAMLPFAVIAAVSTGSRIAQYGFTPDRLWALVFVIVATAYGLAYLVALLRRRLGWAQAVRPANLKLAFALCALALFLSTPILSFNAISARDQVARLQSGRVTPDKFDWAALAFDFGEPGKAATRDLARSGNAAVRAKAAYALKVGNRWDLKSGEETRIASERAKRVIRIIPATVPLPVGLIESFNLHRGDDAPAYALFYRPGDRSAVLVSVDCDRCAPRVSVSRLDEKGAWSQNRADPLIADDAGRAKATAAIKRGAVEIRGVERRQVFVDGVATGEAFE